MANNFTPEQTHNFDQNVAHYEAQVDILVQSWANCVQDSCCPEHTLLNFVDYILDTLQDAGRADVAAMVTCLIRRLASRQEGINPHA